MLESGLNDYLMDAVGAGASDLHITVGLPPMIRVNGQVRALDYPAGCRRAWHDEWGCPCPQLVDTA